jgi:DNA-binding GntR family transcriptional regulator
LVVDPPAVDLKKAFQRSRLLGGREIDVSANLEDETYEQLRQALIDGHFSPGQTFTIRALAEVFGTSPMPVRDALKRLVAEQALDQLPNRSVRVPLMSRARFQEVLQIRLSLEPMIAARAAAHVTPELVAAMAEDHQQMCQAVLQGEVAHYLAANRRFHFRLYEAAATVVMLPLIEALWMQVGPYLNEVFGAPQRSADPQPPDSTRHAAHHHTAVLQALRRHDAPATAQAIWQDLSDAADSILAANNFSS